MPYIIDMKKYILNGITEEVESLESNCDISFRNSYYRKKFIDDLLSEMLEQFENNMEYYGHYNPNFTDAVFDKIQWDFEYYGITILE